MRKSVNSDLRQILEQYIKVHALFIFGMASSVSKEIVVSLVDLRFA